MRRCLVILMTLFAMSLTARAHAQAADQLTFDPFSARPSVTTSVGIVKTSAQTANPQATPDAMVARMMSFDRNHDGLVSRDELPERMQPLLARIEVFTTGDGLDEKEIRRLADNPVAKPQVFVLQAGHYGFGDDNGFDTRLHIESAIEDLRLASTTRDKALEIGHHFVDTTNGQARADLLAAMTPLLTEEQLVTFTAALDHPSRAPSAIFQSADPDRVAALRVALARAERSLQQAQLLALTSSFALGPEQDRQLQAAIEQFKSHERLSEGDRSGLLAQMRGVLSDQERDDLGAALERRPLVKQGAVAVKF